MRAQLGGSADGGDGHEADELALGDVEPTAGGEVAEGGGGQQMGYELVEGLGQGGEDLLDLVTVQRGLDGSAGLLAGAGVGGVHGAGVLQGQGDAVGLEDPVGDVDGVEGLGEADVGGALVDGLAQLERAGADVEGGAHVRSQLREGLHGGQGGDGEQLALDIGEDARGEGLVEDPILEDVEQLGVRARPRTSTRIPRLLSIRIHARIPRTVA